jgi:hypothetical protein
MQKAKRKEEPTMGNNEYSKTFDELREHRMEVSFYKYGPIAENYGKGYVSAIDSLKLRLDKYIETGNTEYLCDVANFAMIEYMYPQIEGAYFKATDRDESPGLIGTPVNKLKGEY